MSDESKPPQFKAVGFLRVDRIQSRIDDKKRFASRSFTSDDDSEPPKFIFYLSFEKDDLHCYLHNGSNRDVFVRGLKFKIWDAEKCTKKREFWSTLECPLNVPAGEDLDGDVGPLSPVKCPQGHDLQLGDRNNGWYCDDRPVVGVPCRGESQLNRYRCQPCNYDLCHDCYQAKREGGTCLVGHPLRINRGRRWRCDGRNDPKLGGCCTELEETYDAQIPSYYCESCGYDLCIKCYSLLPIGTEWNVTCEVVYDGVFVNANFVTQETCNVCNNDLPTHMLALLDSAEDADITFIVEKEEVLAHKAVVKTRSTYFQNMLNSGMKESHASRIELPDVDAAAFKEILKFLYSGLLPKNLPDLAMKLFPLANMYGITVLRDHCITAIHSRLSSENVVEVLALADLHDCKELRDACVSVIQKNSRVLKSEGRLKDLEGNPKLLLFLLNSCLD